MTNRVYVTAAMPTVDTPVVIVDGRNSGNSGNVEHR
jgi:hypothetical protein